MRKIVYILSLLWCVCGCSEEHREVTESRQKPVIFPDYQGITIPLNIAPLNFQVARAEKIEVEFRKGEISLLSCHGKGKIDIPLKKWRTLLQENKGETLNVKIFALERGEWIGYQPFTVTIAADSIDPYLAYRLIEPGYELGKRLGLYQRDLSSFDEEAFVSPQLTEGSCVNCHAFCNYSPDHFMFHVRWKNPGTVIVEPGNVRKVDTKTDAVISAGAYRMWHPSGKYIAFSNNQTRQAFHAFSEKKIEVYDLASGLMIYEVEKDKVLTDPRFTDKNSWMTFPAWSPDGKYLYFCEAVPRNMPMEYKDLKYGLYRVGFDVQQGALTDSIERITPIDDTLRSCVFPTISPDGKYLLYTTVASGTFPIWHKDADLKMINLASRIEVNMDIVNSDAADTYHAWSSTGRWIVFSSRRIDNLYTRVYLAYFDRNGQMHKPFLLPQKDPGFYKLFLKSYNIPEFIKGPVKVSPYQF